MSDEPPNGDQSSPGPLVKVEHTASETSWLENSQHPNLYRPPPNIYAQTRTIADLPLIRPLVLRPGRQIFYLHNPSHGLSNYKTALAYQRGKVQSNPCSCCVGQNPLGPYQQCVVLGNVHSGGCTNCAYDGNGTRCTLRVINSDGSSINPNSVKRKLALRREQTVDRTLKEVINIEDGPVDSTTLTPVIDNDRSASLPPSTGYTRRQAAKVAESRLSNYTYRAADVGGSAIDSDMESRVTEDTPVEGWPDLTKEVSDLPPTETQRPRGTFTARRGGRHSRAHTESGLSGSPKRARTATIENDNTINDASEPLPQRRRIYTSPTPDEDGINVAMPNATPVPDNLKLKDVPLPPKGTVPTAVMTYLLDLPALRTVSWRAGASRSLNLNSQVEAAMGYCVGEIVPPCDRCSRDLGAFQQCVTVTGNFQRSCASCTYTSRASQCSFHVPNSTKIGVVLADQPLPEEPLMKRSSSKSKSSKSKTSPSKLPSGKSNIKPQPPVAMKHITPTSKPDASTGIKAMHRAQSSPKNANKSDGSKLEGSKPVVRSQRYLNALRDAEKMSLEEQQLELADLKFQIWVIGNVISKNTPETTTVRYKHAHIGFEEMSPEEQQLELASFKFGLSIMQDVLAKKNAG